MLVVAKFGGSSVANASQFKKVRDIVLGKEPNYYRNVVIVSALGKKEKDDSKITDLLYLLHAHLKYNVPYTNILEMIKSRFYNIKKELSLSIDLENEFDNLEKELTKDINEDFLVSRGEYITGKMMAEYLGYHFIDASDIIKFNYDGITDTDKSYPLIEESIKKYNKVVIPGFYGTYPNGTIKTFSRGGSDITGSLVAAAIHADFYENWTDVSGILMADPHIIKDSKTIKEITYAELRELSYMGASVLHEQTVFPVQKAGIPIKILNTNSPSDEGTIIREDCKNKDNVITGIAGKKNFTSFTITKRQEVNKLAAIRDVLDVFSKFRINVEHIPSSIDSFSVIVPNSDIEKNLYDVVAEIKRNKDIQDGLRPDGRH